ncbi:MAG: UbiD family decarboxylase [Xanthobacteraceae bacterium]
MNKPVSNHEAMAVEALGDLRKAIAFAEEMGDVEYVDGADPELEIGALYELSLAREHPPVLVFRNIKGYPPGHRIATNVRSSKVFGGGAQGLELVQRYRKHRRKQTDPIPPVTVTEGPVMENVQEGAAVNVLAFPAPRWHEGDGGRYIGTECIVITQDPDNGWVNLGTYRVQVQDKDTLSVFIEHGKHGDMIRRKYWERGRHCPMAISVGQSPVLGAIGAATPGPNVSEYDIAGARLGRPIEVVKGRHTGIPLPADAELVFEGFMPPPEELSAPEGPFGEWPGYYASSIRPEPVLKVKAIYHRNDPIVVGAPPVKPTLKALTGLAMGSAPIRAAALWDELEAAGVPGIKGVWKLAGGGPRFINVIAIEQQHAGHAKMAGLVAAGCGSNAYLGRIVIVVDHDIDITNSAEVMWALATRWDPKTATDIIDGCWTGYIDPTLPPDLRDVNSPVNSRIIIYAVRPFYWKDEFPKVNAVPDDYAETVRAKWAGKLLFLSERS